MKTALKTLTTLLLLSAAILFHSVNSASAQQPDAARSVGVVLSGGGAKGLYHVGILKALEENNIPVDYISGASMGAVIGGLYAIGYSPDDMIRFFESDTVTNWLNGEIPPEYRYFFQKEGVSPEMVTLSLNDIKKANRTGSPVKLPTSLKSSYLLDYAFIKMMTGASWAARENFDSLFIPFRCVATDIYHRKLVTMKDGSLPFAIRSSMSIPFIFNPMKKDSLLLLDGGMINNFPWQVLEEDFKPDIIIGGVCTANAGNPEEDDLIGMIMTVLTSQTDYTLPDNGRNINIKRHMKDVGMLDYYKAKTIIEYGYQDAMEVMPEILKRIGRRSVKEEVEARRTEFRRRIKPIVFDSVSIDGVTEAQKKYLYHQLGYLEQGTDYEIDYFGKKYMKILGSGAFEAKLPRITYDPVRERYQLHLNMTAKPQINFSLGGHLSSTSLNQIYMGFRYSHVTSLASTYTAGGILGSFYNTVSAGGRHDFYTNFPFFIQYNYSWEQFDYTSNHMRRYTGDSGFEMGTNVSNCLNFGFGASAFSDYVFKINWTGAVDEFKYYPGEHISTDDMDNTNFKSSDLVFSLRKNSLNYQKFASEGKDFKVRFHYWVGVESYQMGNSQYSRNTGIENFEGKNRTWIEAGIKYERYHNLGRWFNLGYLVDGKYSNAPEFGNWLATYFMRTQFSPTPHSETMFMTEFRSASHVALGIVPIIKFTNNQKFYLKAYAYGYLPQETLYENGQWNTFNTETIGKHIMGIFGGSLVYQTPLGPGSITYNKYTTGPSNWSLMVNFGLSLFNINKP